MKKTLALILSLSMALALFGCGGSEPTGGTKTTDPEPTETENEGTPVDPVFTEDAPRALIDMASGIKLVGRTSVTKYGQNIDYPGSGFELHADFQDTALTVNYTIDKKVNIAAFVDGEPYERYLVEGRGTVTIPNLSGEHTVKFVRDGETKDGNQSLFTKVAFNGTLLEKPADKDFYIEAIGDSIVSGNGILTKDNTPGVLWDAADHSATNAFAYQVATALDADLSIIGRGSIGMVKEVEDIDGAKFAMPALYKLTTGLSKATREEFDFSTARVPDLILLEVSTNDRSTVDSASFKKAATEFIKDIRASYGKDVPILWVHDLMIEDHHKTEIGEIATELGGEAAGIYTLQLTPGQDGGRGTQEGTCHPSLENQTVHANEILSFIQEKKLK